MGHIARIGERRGVYGILVGKPERKNHFEDPGVDGRIILRWIFKKWDMRTWAGSLWLRQGRRRVLVKAVMNIRVSYNARNFLTS